MQNRDDNHCSCNHKPELKCIENGRLNLADNLHELTGVEILLLSQKSHVGTNYNHEITVSIMQISQQLPQLSCNLLLIKSRQFFILSETTLLSQPVQQQSVQHRTLPESQPCTVPTVSAVFQHVLLQTSPPVCHITKCCMQPKPCHDVTQ